MFCYLKKHLTSRLVYGTEMKDMSDVPFTFKCIGKNIQAQREKYSPTVW